ncbi:unnamed protein product [Phytophthora lilii]|uniref:Unnamed protein product n=1 Tax=Phytophthora lilii TaxID=2077276 RepID=A0A9W6U591_9STRA|nr:unnamed protein product [Phytophthora lilii]
MVGDSDFDFAEDEELDSALSDMTEMKAALDPAGDRKADDAKAPSSSESSSDVCSQSATAGDDSDGGEVESSSHQQRYERRAQGALPLALPARRVKARISRLERNRKYISGKRSGNRNNSSERSQKRNKFHGRRNNDKSNDREYDVIEFTTLDWSRATMDLGLAAQEVDHDSVWMSDPGCTWHAKQVLTRYI